MREHAAPADAVPPLTPVGEGRHPSAERVAITMADIRRKVEHAMAGPAEHCSKCGAAHRRDGQRYCARCHAAYMVDWRRRQKRKIAALMRAAAPFHGKHPTKKGARS